MLFVGMGEAYAEFGVKGGESMMLVVARRLLNYRTIQSGAHAFACLCLSRIIQVAIVLLLVAPDVAFSQSMSLPGNLSVGATGAAIFSIPVAVPPGTAGVAPTLTIDFNSQAGNGLLGIGWSLGGLPLIGRCPQTIAQDGITRGINFGAGDRFCLDGQRLVAISGAYGADGTEYRTEIESFSRVISHGAAGSGPSWFEVRTKSGQVMEFGHTVDSLILAQGKSTARAWALNKVSDTKGNYYTVSYTNDTANGQAYPIEINYAGNAAASLSPYNKVQFLYAGRPDSTPIYQAGSLIQSTVRLTNIKTFSGSTLVGDYRLAYQQGAPTQTSILNTVTLCAGDGSCLPANVFTSTTGGDGTYAVSGQFFPYSWDFGVPGVSYDLLSGDFNGDGKTDFVFFGSGWLATFTSNGDGTFSTWGQVYQSGMVFATPPHLNMRPIVGDLNGDGKLDIFVVGADIVISFISNGNGSFSVSGQPFPSGWNFGAPGSTATVVPVTTTSGMLTTTSYAIVPGTEFDLVSGDFNGDGKTDFAFFGTGSNATFISNGDGSFSPFSQLYQSGMVLAAPPSSNRALVVGDINGDGKSDLMVIGGDIVISFISNGNGSFAFAGQPFPSGWSFGVPGTTFDLVSGDFNGDGNADFAFFGNGSYATFLSNGNGSFTPSSNVYQPGMVLAQPPHLNMKLVVGDVNGDGRLDVMVIGADIVLSFISKGDGSWAVSGQPFPSGWNFGVPGTSFELISGDFNGDGKTDFAFFGNGSNATFISNGNGSFYPLSALYQPGMVLALPPSLNMKLIVCDINGDGKSDLIIVGATIVIEFMSNGSNIGQLTSVTSGLGAVTTVTYQPLTKSSVYTKDATSVYPVLDIVSPLYVVSRVDTANGIGGNVSAAYSYAGAKVDVNGRGFLGFRQIKATDLQTNIVRTTNYRQDFPFLGLTASATTMLGAQTLNQTTSSFQFSNASGAATVSAPSTSGAPYRASVAQSVTSGNDLDGTALPSTTSTFQYDAYGNATQVAVTNSDGSSKTTTNTYTNNATNWLLGRLTASTVTGQAP
jgi:hypothetical protein